MENYVFDTRGLPVLRQQNNLLIWLMGAQRCDSHYGLKIAGFWLFPRRHPGWDDGFADLLGLILGLLLVTRYRKKQR